MAVLNCSSDGRVFHGFRGMEDARLQIPKAPRVEVICIIIFLLLVWISRVGRVQITFIKSR